VAGQGKKRQFPTAYKLKAIKRVERGEGALPAARELGISYKILHDWIKAWNADTGSLSGDQLPSEPAIGHSCVRVLRMPALGDTCLHGSKLPTRV
jgi:transposase-like protein